MGIKIAEKDLKTLLEKNGYDFVIDDIDEIGDIYGYKRIAKDLFENNREHINLSQTGESDLTPMHHAAVHTSSTILHESNIDEASTASKHSATAIAGTNDKKYISNSNSPLDNDKEKKDKIKAAEYLVGKKAQGTATVDIPNPKYQNNEKYRSIKKISKTYASANNIDSKTIGQAIKGANNDTHTKYNINVPDNEKFKAVKIVNKTDKIQNLMKKGMTPTAAREKDKNDRRNMIKLAHADSMHNKALKKVIVKIAPKDKEEKYKAALSSVRGG